MSWSAEREDFMLESIVLFVSIALLMALFAGGLISVGERCPKCERRRTSQQL